MLLLIAGALFLRVVFERGLIGELGRVTLGLAAGVALCAGGYVLDRRGWRLFAQMLTAGGIALLFLSTYATFGFYRLLNQTQAAPFLVAVIAEALALAVLYESPAVALMAVVGGLLTPLLLATDEDRYLGLFAYLALLDAGVVGLVIFRGWWASATVALLGTHAIFWAWYVANYHPAKRPAALVFQAVVFALFLLHTIVGQVMRGRPAGIEALVRFVLNAVLIAAAGYTLLEADYDGWMGTAAVGMATLYALLAWLVLVRRPAQQALTLLALATSMGFVATVFPLQAEAAWIAVGWAAQGVALWWFGLRTRTPALRALAAAFLALAGGRLLVVDTLATSPHVEPFVPILNRYALPALAVVAALLGAAALSFRARPVRLSADFVAMRVLSLAGLLLLWIVVSVEAYDFFMTRADYPPANAPQVSERSERLEHLAQTSLSVVWALYAVGVLLVGFRFRSRPLRWLALVVFGLTLLKVVVIDTQALTGFYRVTAYLVLAVVMGAAAWAYQKVRRALLLRAPEASQ